jgi:hypothetical protein
VVECTALEMRHARKGIGGSNPSLSASFPIVHSGDVGEALATVQHCLRNYPRPTSGIFVAITVKNGTLAPSGRPAM